MRTRLLMLASLTAASQLAAQEVTTPVVPEATPQQSSEVAATSVSEIPPSAPSMDAAPVADAVAPAEEAPSHLSTINKDTLSVDFPDEEVRTILRNIADLFELNLVIPDTLQGRTSLKLREVTWRQIFQVILSPIGYTFVEDGNIIKIVSQTALAEEPLTTEIFIVNYAKAEDIKKSIDGIIDSAVGGKVVVDTRSNGLVITERPSRLAKIRPIVDKLDRATDQVMIESKFIEIRSSNATELGLAWSVGGGSKGGIYTSYNGGVRGGGNYQTGYIAPISPNLGSPIRIGDPSKLTTNLLTGADYSAVLRAAESNNKARVVNNPTLVTLNNVQAEINIGEEYPIPSYTYNAERGAFEVSGFEYKPIGVLLKVTPQINSQGFVKLTLEPEISQRGDPVNFGGASGADIPIITTRKTKTQVSLQDGHTLGIGGLIKDEDLKTGTQLPILGSIPVIGRLFQNNKKEKSRTNLLIFITAKIVSSNTAKPEEVFDPRVLRDANLKRSDITGYRDNVDPFVPEDASGVKSSKLKTTK